MDGDIMRFIIYEDEQIFNDLIKEKLNAISMKLDISFDIIFAENEISLLLANEVEGINVNIVDIEHKNKNLQGIAMASLLREKFPKCHIIFFTSHMEKTYEVLNSHVEPLAYIYKGDQNVKYILENAIQKIISTSVQRKDELILEFKDAKGEKLFVRADEIHYITTDELRQKYIRLYLYGSAISVKGILRDYINITKDLVQVSKSTVVNKSKIKSIKKDINPKNKLIITSRPDDEKNSKCVLTPKYKKNLS